MSRQRAVVDAYLAAAREGDFERLVSLLDPDVVLRSDGGTLRPGATVVVRGAREVATRAMSGARLAAARPALINGAAGMVAMRDGQVFAVLGFTVLDDRIVAIDALSDPERVGEIDVTFLDA